MHLLFRGRIFGHAPAVLANSIRAIVFCWHTCPCTTIAATISLCGRPKMLDVHGKIGIASGGNHCAVLSTTTWQPFFRKLSRKVVDRAALSHALHIKHDKDDAEKKYS